MQILYRSEYVTALLKYCMTVATTWKLQYCDVMANVISLDSTGIRTKSVTNHPSSVIEKYSSTYVRMHTKAVVHLHNPLPTKNNTRQRRCVVILSELRFILVASTYFSYQAEVRNPVLPHLAAANHLTRPPPPNNAHGQWPQIRLKSCLWPYQR